MSWQELVLILVSVFVIYYLVKRLYKKESVGDNNCGCK